MAKWKGQMAWHLASHTCQLQPLLLLSASNCIPMSELVQFTTARWSELPCELLETILDRLPLPDRFRFPAVCTSWQLASTTANAAATQLQTAQSPWLMLPFNPAACKNNTAELSSSAAAAAARFFSLSEHRAYTIQQPGPNISDRLCIGSSGGWLVTANAASELHLLNPVTGVQIQLPSVTTLPFVHASRAADGHVTNYNLRFSFIDDDGDEIAIPPESFAPDRLRYDLYEKAILVSRPRQLTSSGYWGGYTVMLIYQPLFKLAIARAGDNKWTLLDTPSRCWVDAICASSCAAAGAQQVIYTMDSTGRVVAWDIDISADANGSSPAPLVSRVVAPPCHRSGCPCSIGGDCGKYLVELSLGHLLQVHRWRSAAHTRYKWEPRPEYVEYTTVKVELFEWKFGSRDGRWTQVATEDGKGSLNGRALFLGKNASLCISLHDCPELKGNCIYFTDDCPWSFERCHEVAPDVGVFDLADASYKPCGASHDLLWKWPPPIWVMPMLPEVV